VSAVDDLAGAISGRPCRREKLAIVTMCFKPVTQQQRLDHLGESNLVVALDPTVKRVLHYDEQSPGHPGPKGAAGAAPPLALAGPHTTPP